MHVTKSFIGTRSLQTTRSVLSAGIVSLMLAGCFGPDNPDTAEVYGKVTMNGEPVTAGRVVFFPIGTTGKLAQAILDSDGEFELHTYGSSDGAVIGQHRITVLSNPDPSSGEDATSLGKPDPAKVTVKAGESNEFHIKLTPHAEGSDRDEDEDD